MNVKAFPWIIWYLWKSRNGLIFERRHYSSVSVLLKAKEEANVWFELNVLGNEGTQTSLTTLQNSPSWTRPPSGYLKCNIGVSWINNQDLCGVGWILRDDKGTTILHSRRAFSNVESQNAAELMAMQWAVSDMVSTRQQKIIFESSCVLARQTLTAPAESTDWRHLRTDIQLRLRALQDWSFHHCEHWKNTIAQEIAVSVTSDRRYQSYISCGGPTWLLQRIESEAAT